jgi:uncharacterized protein involved in outer membrane biogenesis
MNEAATSAPPRRPLWAKVLAGLVVFALLLVLLVAFFPWDVLRGPLNRYVSDQTGRHFEITRRLDVKVGRTTRLLADGITFANPEWAKDAYLVKAEGAEIDIELLPLLFKRHIVLPRVELRQPQLGLQIESDGRRTWALGRDSSDPKNIPDVDALVVDKGSAHFISSERGADIHVDFSIEGSVMPLSFSARGTWAKEPFTAKGRTGNVLHLSAPLQDPFPIEIDAAAGGTSLRAHGSIASLSTLAGANAVFDLQGQNLADLYKLVGVVLPETPRYMLHGQVDKNAEVWRVRDIKGKLGNSDLSGELAYDRTQKVPQLVGNLKSNWLDFNDLAPLVGIPEQPAPGSPAVAQEAHKAKKPHDPTRKILPTAPLDLARMKAMNSEVTYMAAKVTNARHLPIDRISAGVNLKNGVLKLDPLSFGIAGGTMTGQLHIDSHSNPATVEAHLKGKSLELSRMFRDVRLTQSSFGKIHGDVHLKGRGNTTAQMLASASGDVSLLMGQGQISNLLLEFAGLDGAEIIKFLLRGDKNVKLRCAAAAFDVKDGLMTSRALVLDTDDTVIWGDGNVNFGTEAMDLYFRPYPKDTSILSVRSPIKITGTLGAPHTGPDQGALAGRAAVALALGAINPLLALAATLETGPGEDADCRATLRVAASPNAEAPSRGQRRGAVLGGPPKNGGQQ